MVLEYIFELKQLAAKELQSNNNSTAEQQAQQQQTSTEAPKKKNTIFNIKLWSGLSAVMKNHLNEVSLDSFNITAEVCNMSW